MTYLFQRPDFPELVNAAAEYHGIPRPAIVEKDYYVTEVLRLLAEKFGEGLIFRGGTSLSKGWKLIQRFSEDVDVFVRPGDAGQKARNTLLKRVIACVAAHPGLTLNEQTVKRIKGVARSADFDYRQARDGSAFHPKVLLEVGVRSGTFPTEVRAITSLLSEFLLSRGVALESKELRSFRLSVLHFRRTFLEKMYALHDKVARGWLQFGQPIGTYARHYYDIAQLADKPEVSDMLQGGELAEIARDYRDLVQRFFPDQLLPDGMNLDDSPALFPDEDLAKRLEREYVQQCATLCFGPYPPFRKVLAALDTIRPYLRVDLDRD